MRLGKATSIYLTNETRARMEALHPGQGVGKVLADLLEREERESLEDQLVRRVVERIEARMVEMNANTGRE